MQYLLILYYGLHVASPTQAMITSPLNPATCQEMAHIGSDAKHVTACYDMPTVGTIIQIHGCKLTETSDSPGMPSIFMYHCRG